MPTPTSAPPPPAPIAPATIIPQIATSKKDISKNLSKLNLISATNQSEQSHESDKIPECKTEKLSTPFQKYVYSRQPHSDATINPVFGQATSHNHEAQSYDNCRAYSTIALIDILFSTPVSSQPQVFNIFFSNQASLKQTCPQHRQHHQFEDDEEDQSKYAMSR